MKPILFLFSALLCCGSGFAQIFTVRDIAPGAMYNSSPVIYGTLPNGKILFSASEASSRPSGFERRLWTSNGQYNFTGYLSPKQILVDAPVTNYGANTYVYEQGKLITAAYSDSTGYEILATDGTETGTKFIIDLSAAGQSSVNHEVALHGYNGKVYFPAFDGADINMYTTNGTVTGTYDLITLAQGIPHFLTIFMYYASGGGKLYFSFGERLYSTDGTPQGSVLEGTPLPQGIILSMAYVNNRLLLCTSDTASWLYSYQPVGGFSLVKKMYGAGFVHAGGKLLFAGDDGASGMELWETDGTTSGTKLVKDIESGSGDSNPTLIAELNGKLIFSATTGSLGKELWTSDGTTTGTINLMDIKQGPGDGFLHETYGNPVNDHIDSGKYFFAAYTADSGGIWTTDGTPGGTKPLVQVPYHPGVCWLHTRNGRIWMCYESADGFELSLYGEPVGVHDIPASENNFQAYPNPSGGSFTIDLQDKMYKEGRLLVYDMMGRLMHKQDISKGLQKMPVILQDIPAGLYNVVLRLDNEVTTQRISIER